MGDILTSYETGLQRLLKQLGDEHPRYAEVVTLQSRLLDNIAQSRRYGDTEMRRAERVQIIDAVNRLAIETVGINLDEISGTLKEDAAVFLSPSVTWTADNRSGGVYLKGEGPVHIEGDVVGGDQTKTTHETHFHAPVNGLIHTESVDISLIRRLRTRLIAVSTVVAAILGIASNILAAYLQNQFNLLNDQGRLIVVAAVFTVSLAIGTWLAVKQGQGLS